MPAEYIRWNIDGAFSRVAKSRVCILTDPLVVDLLSKIDIFFLTDKLSLDDFQIFDNKRKKIPKCKPSGGISVGVRTNLRKGVKILPFSSSEYIWIRLDRKFFNLKRDLFIAGAYIAPRNSHYFSLNDNIFEMIESDKAKFMKAMSSVVTQMHIREPMKIFV